MNSKDQSAIIDRLCDRYEKALRLGEPESIVEFLKHVSESSRPALVRELVLLDQELLDEERFQDRLKKLQQELAEYVTVLTEFVDESPQEYGTLSCQDPVPSRQIGPYKILQTIGEGGMGSVYMAEQKQPVRRRVALKIIRAGLDSKPIIARFEAERQALAMMDHPSIARILDAGTTETGQPFFAMELVKGIPLTEYCDRHRLSISDRLSIFRQICEGIQHAHQKGILHRDLKPANILVAEYNGRPVPKIIDFGLAKALEVTNKLTDKTMFTEFGQVMGTLKYMSPEQAGLDSLDIDTRSDIYTLGVILYELLTGSTPLDSETIKDQALLKVLQLVREQEALRPSNRLTTSKETLTAVTKQRCIDPRKLNQILCGDLDWIVMKAIDKDRTRRYESASAFGEDVRRFLDDEAVDARPPSASYKLRKFVKKNRGLVASISAIATLLVLAVTVSTLFALSEREARLDAVASESNSRKQNEFALSTLTTVISDLQVGLKDVPGGGPLRMRILESTMEKLSEVSQQYIDSSSVDIQSAKAMLEMSEVLVNFDKAQPNVFQRSKTDWSATANQSGLSLSETFLQAAEEIVTKLKASNEADAGYQDVAATLQLQTGDLAIAKGEIEKGKSAYANYLEAVQGQVDRDRTNRNLRKLSTAFERLGNVADRQGNLSAAKSNYLEMHKLKRTIAESMPDDDNAQREFSVAMSHLGHVAIESLNIKEAKRQYERAFEIDFRLATESPDNTELQSDLAISCWNLGRTNRRLGNANLTNEYYEKSRDIYSKLAESDPTVLSWKVNVAYVWSGIGDLAISDGRLKDGQVALNKSLEISNLLIEKMPEDRGFRNEKAGTLRNLGLLRLRQNEPQLALEAFRQTQEIFQKLAEIDSSDAAVQRDLSIAFADQGDAYIELGKSELAQESFKECLRIQQVLFEKDPTRATARQDLALTIYNQGTTYLASRDLDSALERFEIALDHRDELFESDPQNTRALSDLATTLERIGLVYERRKEWPKADDYYRQQLELEKQLAIIAPENMSAKRSLLVAHTHVAKIARITDKKTEALKHYELALVLAQQRSEWNREDSRPKSDLATCYGYVGELSGELTDFDRAKEALVQQRDIYLQLCEENPNSNRLRQSLMVSYDRLGQTVEMLKDYELAIRCYESGSEIMEQMIEDGVNVDLSRQYLDVLQEKAVRARRSSDVEDDDE